MYFLSKKERRMKRYFSFIICLLLSVCTIAQNYPIKNIGGTDYYVYTVEPSEGLYRISKKFNVLQSDIYKANPGVNEGLKAGQTLYIPVNNKNIDAQNASAKIIEHQVVAKQTLYSIGKMYGVEKNEILRLNPDIDNGIIKVGQIIKIPVSDTNKAKAQENAIQKINEEQTESKIVKKEQQQPSQPKIKFVTYEVKKKKETLYSISKQFGVSINEIIEANPYVQNGIKKGDILQIPIIEENIPKNSNGDLIHIVKPKETIYGISKQYDIAREELLKNNPQLQNGLKTGDTIVLYVNEQHDKTIDTNLSNNDINRAYKVVYLLPFSAEDNTNATNIDRFVEFYRGSLIAMEKVKEDGITLDIYTFDTQLGTSKIQDILKNKIPQDIDMIIGPAYPDQVSLVANYARKNNIIQVVPFTSQIKNADKFDLQYQFNPSSSDLDMVVINNILDDYKNNNIFFVNFDSKDNKSYQLPERFEKAARANGAKYVKINASSITSEQIAYLSRNPKSLIILSACTTQEFKEFTNSLNFDLKDFIFITDTDIFNFAKEDKVLKKNNFITYSLFNATPTSKYLSSYNEYFTVRNQTSIPNYDLLGYDLTLYFCTALRVNRQLNFDSNIALQQSTFNFTKQNNGFLNTGCFIYHLNNNNLSIEKL